VNLTVTKTFNNEEGPKHLNYHGEAFGELALLYNASSAVKEDLILWTLYRETFNHILKRSLDVTYY
jgi:hypothetical protein